MQVFRRTRISSCLKMGLRLIGIMALLWGFATLSSVANEVAGDLIDITEIDDLKVLFNEDAGITRIILLVDPTCSFCIAGTRWLKQEILEIYPDSALKIYAIWFLGLPFSSRSSWDISLLDDPRVTHLWDEQALFSEWFLDLPELPVEYKEFVLLYDMFFLFGPDASWEEVPSPLLGTGYTIYEFREELKEKLVPLLNNE